jgi:DNA adenine methylase
VPENNDQQVFYDLRNEFNTTNDSRVKSALFIYLNRHCFNGLCRYNSKGGYNVPFGRYTKPVYPEKEMRDFYLKSRMATFQQADFRSVMENARIGDVVYCDPPYVPLTDTANFTDYSVGGFNMQDHQDLADLAKKLQSKGIPVLVSNHSTDWTKKSYSTAIISEFQVQRFISSDSQNRNKASELLAMFR